MFIERQPHRYTEIIQNKIDVHGKEPVPPMIIVENNRDHFIKLHNITTVSKL